MQMQFYNASIFSPLILGTLLRREELIPPRISEKHRSTLAAILHAILLPVITGIILLVWDKYEPGQKALEQALVQLNQGLAGGMPMELTWSLTCTIRMVWLVLTPWKFLGGHMLTFGYYPLVVSLTFFGESSMVDVCHRFYSAHCFIFSYG